MNSPIKYYGGKSYMTDIILAHQPKNFDVYIEGFGGGASVLFAKPKSPIEIYNDLGENVYSLFKCLVDEELFKELKHKLDLTPYSAQLRDEYKEDLKYQLPLLERAYRYLYVNRTSFNSVGGFSTNLIVRRNMSKSTSDYLSMIDGLYEVHNRLSSVIIEHRDILDLIDKYDAENVWFYLDPPYVHSTRSSSTMYEHEMTDEDHVRLIERIQESKGKFLICGYDNPLYELPNFHKYSYPSPNSSSDRIETIWWNYECNEEVTLQQVELFL